MVMCFTDGGIRFLINLLDEIGFGAIVEAVFKLFDGVLIGVIWRVDNGERNLDVTLVGDSRLPVIDDELSGSGLVEGIGLIGILLVVVSLAVVMVAGGELPTGVVPEVDEVGPI